MHMMQIVNPQTNTQIAALVRGARRQLGLNQGQFAQKLGKSQAVVSRYEQGSVEPPGEVVMRCVHILGGIHPASETRVSSWADLLATLEGAVAIVKAMQEAPSGRRTGDTVDENSRLPRQA